jgi:hypothetical protein
VARAADPLGIAHVGTAGVQIDLRDHGSPGLELEDEGQLCCDEASTSRECLAVLEAGVVEDCLEPLERLIEVAMIVDQQRVIRDVSDPRPAVRRERGEQPVGAAVQLLTERSDLGGETRVVFGGALHIVSQVVDAPIRHLKAEVLRGDLVQVVCLVEDGQIVRRHQGDADVTEPLLQRQVGEVEVVVDDDDLRGLCASARDRHPAALEVCAMPARALLRRGAQLAPHWGVVGHLGQLCPVAGRRFLPPARHGVTLAVVEGRQQPLRHEPVRAQVAEVVGAALHHLDVEVDAERSLDERQVLADDLVLQVLRARRDDHLQTRGNRGEQVGERFADTGPGLGDELAAALQRRFDATRDLELLGARFVTVEPGCERAVGGKQLVERLIDHQQSLELEFFGRCVALVWEPFVPPRRLERWRLLVRRDEALLADDLERDRRERDGEDQQRDGTVQLLQSGRRDRLVSHGRVSDADDEEEDGPENPNQPTRETAAGLHADDDAEQEQEHDDDCGDALLPVSEDGVGDVPAVELGRRDQVDRCDEQADPAGERHRVQRDLFGAGSASGVEPTEQDRMPVEDVLRPGHVERRRLRQAPGRERNRDEQPGVRSRDGDVQEHASVAGLVAQQNHGAERAKDCRRWDEVGQRLIDAVAPGGDEVAGLVHDEERHECHGEGQTIEYDRRMLEQALHRLAGRARSEVRQHRGNHRRTESDREQQEVDPDTPRLRLRRRNGRRRRRQNRANSALRPVARHRQRHIRRLTTPAVAVTALCQVLSRPELPRVASVGSPDLRDLPS